jgi:hypothetical protein
MESLNESCEAVASRISRDLSEEDESDEGGDISSGSSNENEDKSKLSISREGFEVLVDSVRNFETH